MSVPEDTIAAIATGPGGSIAIIRLSGADALAVAARVWRGRRALAKCPPRTMVLGRVVDAQGIAEDRCLAVYMPHPRSYTGEDVVEFHAHGGALAARAVLTAVLYHGARLAEPGEFTRRAFLNGKLDLTQAEAVLDIIEAHSTLALHAANRQLAGLLRRRIEALHTDLAAVLAEVEARLDFADEHLDFASPEVLAAQLASVLAGTEELLRARGTGEILRQGVRVAIVGIPNAGKSSLLNLLLGRDRAIVSPVPGTTRDTVEEPTQIRGIPVQLIDTAGLRDAGDELELAGVTRSYAALDTAVIVLWVLDATVPLARQAPEPTRLVGKRVITVLNKTDLTGPLAAPGFPAPVVCLAATTGAGLDHLYDCIETSVWGQPLSEEPDLALSVRHSHLLETAAARLRDAAAGLPRADWELVAVDLRLARDALGRIVGRTLEPDLLDQVFARFCIGK